jgi:CRISPR-associated protein Csd2
MSESIKKRYEFAVLFDVENGNPNGDPDAGNMPRIDPETGLGIVTDVCIKRKIRNYVEIIKPDQILAKTRFNIYVKEGAILNLQHKVAYDALGLKSEDKKLPAEKEKALSLTQFMCEHFFDIRTFGAVMAMGVNCGQVRGPVQLNFARSIDPILQQEITITRVAVTTEKDAKDKSHEMGRKHIVPYGLYMVQGYVSAHLANQTGFNTEDLELLWEALVNMFEHDHSAARGKMTTRKLIIFEHATLLGNAPSHKLFDLIHIERKDSTAPARNYTDYDVAVSEAGLPSGVKLIIKE